MWAKVAEKAWADCLVTTASPRPRPTAICSYQPTTKSRPYICTAYINSPKMRSDTDLGHPNTYRTNYYYFVRDIPPS